MNIRALVSAALLLGGAVLSAAPSPAVVKVREWRAAHERQILAELMQLVSLPNIASNQADILKNADALTTMFEKRGFTVNRITTPGSPLLVARRDAANAVGTLTFYMHYDGQPTDPKGWTMGAPFAPRAYLGQAPVDLAASTGPVHPEVRVYGRAVADDKGPIVAFLAAMDGLRDTEAVMTMWCRSRPSNVVPLTRSLTSIGNSWNNSALRKLSIPTAASSFNTIARH